MAGAFVSECAKGVYERDASVLCNVGMPFVRPFSYPSVLVFLDSGQNPAYNGRSMQKRVALRSCSRWALFFVMRWRVPV